MVDLIDKKLIFELNKNSRQTSTMLGKRLRISKQVVSYRINKLEKEGIIKSYHALIDWRRLGFNAIRVYLKWKNISLEVENKIYSEIEKNPFFMWAVKFEGEMDIGFYLWTKSMKEFSQNWFSFLAKYRKYISKQEIYESVKMVHYPMKPLVDNYLLSRKTIGEGEVEIYDGVDYKILKIMAYNGRISIVKLAKKIGLTPKATLHRIKKLEKKKIIQGYNAFIDTNKLGYEFHKIDFYLNDIKNIKKMFSFAEQNKNIVYRMRTVGGPDFEVEAMVKNASEMKQLINKSRKSFSNVIDHYRVHRFEYSIKQVYFPGEILPIEK